MYSNGYLNEAFRLKREGKLKEAVGFLMRACDSGSGEALWYAADMYYEGGWGVKTNVFLSKTLMVESVGAGCFWGCRAITSFESGRGVEEADATVINSGDWLAILHQLPYHRDERMPFEQQKKYLESLAKQGHILAIRILSRRTFCDDVEGLYWIKIGIQLGDDSLMQRYYYRYSYMNREREMTLHYLKIAAKNKYSEAITDLYWHHNHENNRLQMAKYGLKSRDTAAKKEIAQRLKYLMVSQLMVVRLPDEILDELWLYGRALQQQLCPLLIREIRCKVTREQHSKVYIETMIAVRKAIQCWSCVAVSCYSHTLNKDIRIKIAKEVWKSRKQPAIWLQ